MNQNLDSMNDAELLTLIAKSRNILTERWNKQRKERDEALAEAISGGAKKRGRKSAHVANT
jgi:hypothetical protein